MPTNTSARRAAAPKATERRNSLRALGVLGILLGVLVAGALGTAAWVLINAQQALDRSTNGHGGSIIDVLAPGTPEAPSDTGRVNMLIAGNTADDPGHPGGQLTDGIIVASVDSATSNVTLLSIPRDLWVEYDGGHMKINAVSVRAGGGQPGLEALGKVVERVTGLHIDRHTLVGVVAFKNLVDAVGGIEVTINSTDPRGIGDPNIGLYLPSGKQELDGETAMKLASARNDPVPGKESYGLGGSDYSRQESQRMILAAIVQKVRTTPTLANPIKVVGLFNDLSKNITTDVNATDIKWLLSVAGDGGAPSSLSIRGEPGHLLIRNYTGAGGSAAQAPTAGVYDYSAIKKYIAAKLA